MTPNITDYKKTAQLSGDAGPRHLARRHLPRRRAYAPRVSPLIQRIGADIHAHAAALRHAGRGDPI